MYNSKAFTVEASSGVDADMLNTILYQSQTMMQWLETVQVALRRRHQKLATASDALRETNEITCAGSAVSIH